MSWPNALPNAKPILGFGQSSLHLLKLNNKLVSEWLFGTALNAHKLYYIVKMSLTQLWYPGICQAKIHALEV